MSKGVGPRAFAAMSKGVGLRAFASISDGAGLRGAAILVGAALWFGSALTITTTASAQDVFVDGEIDRNVRHDPRDSLVAAAGLVVDSLRGQGHYFAGVDSILERETYISTGPRVHVGAIGFRGIPEDEAVRMRTRMETRQGRVLDPARLETDLQQILASYEREGFALAAATVDEIGLVDSTELAVSITISKGPQVRLKRVQLPQGARTSTSFVARLVGHQPGAIVTRYDPELIRRRLEETGLYETVGVPQLIVEPDTGAVLFIPLEEADPGSFDLVLGYLPPQGPAEKGSIVGNGRLEMRNMMGGGRRISVRLNRLPNQVSSIDVSAGDPFLLGLPIGVEGRFNGMEQDSTFGKQAYEGELQYRFEGGMTAFGGFSREVTRPGQAGLRLARDGRQVIPRSDAWFLGLGMRFENVDRRINPTRGLFVETNLETGAKEVTDRRIVGSDTTSVTRSIDQKRLQAAVRFYLPAFGRQVLVLGADGGLLVSESYDRSDLFRFGGATSLRGYDEERFLGSAVARGLAEYRFLIDRASYAYLFIDLGFVDRPETPDLASAGGFHPGYGMGIQFRSALGLVNVSAALNPDAGPTDARIHAGLSFGL